MFQVTERGDADAVGLRDLEDRLPFLAFAAAAINRQRDFFRCNHFSITGFVAQVEEDIVGYLTGAKSKRLSEKVFTLRIAPRLFFKMFKSGVLLKGKNIVFIFNCLLEMFGGGFLTPDFTREYPATLHINIKDEFRGKDIGAGLLGAYLNYLKEEGITGVHLATMSDAGADFFFKYGFKLLYKGKRSYFKHILHKDVPLYVFGKKIGKD